jgi:hypothetical protein
MQEYEREGGSGVYDSEYCAEGSSRSIAVRLGERRVFGGGLVSGGSRRAFGGRFVGALVLAVVVLLIVAAPVFARETHILLSTFNGSDAPSPFGAAGKVPPALAVDNSATATGGDVYVTDDAHAVVDRFDASGKYLSQIDGSETPHKSFRENQDIEESLSLAVDPASGDLYVSLPSVGMIDKFDESGGVVSGFGDEGDVSAANIPAEAGGVKQLGAPGVGAPFQPVSVAVDPGTAELYVGDEANGVVDVFSASGEYLRQFAVQGSPLSLAIDAAGHLFVSTSTDSSALNELDVYEAASGLLDVAYGAGNGQLAVNDEEVHYAVAVDPGDNDLYIGHFGANKIGVDDVVDQYNDAGEPATSFEIDGVESTELAVGKANSDVYLMTQAPNGSSFASIYGPTVRAAEPRSESASEVKVESAVLNGVVNPNGLPVTECFFEYGPSEAYGEKASCEAPDAGEIPVAEGEDRVHAGVKLLQPDSAYYFRLVTANENGAVRGHGESILLPTGEADVVHTIDGEGHVSVRGLVAPDGSRATYWFEFVGEHEYEEGSWSGAASTPRTGVEATGGEVPVAAVIPALVPGAAYMFREAVESEAFPGVFEHSPAKRLMVPAPAVAAAPACPNEAERVGASARLPDCRAYEQVTPVEKGGAEDNFEYSGIDTVISVGRDGEHVFMESLAKYGGNVSANKKTDYLFTRGSGGWGMTSLTPQPQTAYYSDQPYPFFTPDLSSFLIERYWETSINAASKSFEFVVGPAGGPYHTAASEPSEPAPSGIGVEHLDGAGAGWVAQSRNGAVAVLESDDRELVPGHRTGTTAGYDLYEYADGHLSQVNVYSDGETIGSCGAELVQGHEGAGERGKGQGSVIAEGGGVTGSVNAVSADGSRIFFEASPEGCPSRKEEEGRTQGGPGGPKSSLYMRVDGSETVDIGAYTFEGANPQGTRLFLSRASGDLVEYFSYDTESGSAKHLFSLNGTGMINAISENGEDYFFTSDAALTAEAPGGQSNLYRYDIPAETLTYIATYYSGGDNSGYYVSPDGEDFYFNADTVSGVSGSEGGNELETYRYDGAEDVVQCVACASSYDPEPRLLSAYIPDESGAAGIGQHAPLAMTASENGDFVFFDTPAALVPRDVDGETPPAGAAAAEDFSEFFSPSSDVYEWRRDGVDGCGLVQGCVALITDGVDGLKNTFLGTDPSGRDVFFATHSQLLPQDKDRQGDIYDARIGGGFLPPAARPTECEGDACSTPVAAPNDATPASATFRGAGNISQSPVGGTKSGTAGGRKKAGKRKHRAGKKGHRAANGAGRRRRARVRGRSSRSADGRRLGEGGGR